MRAKYQNPLFWDAPNLQDLLNRPIQLPQANSLGLVSESDLQAGFAVMTTVAEAIELCHVDGLVETAGKHAVSSDSMILGMDTSGNQQ